MNSPNLPSPRPATASSRTSSPQANKHKNITTATAALDALLLGRVERSTPVIALGGGVVGDLAGFVAATLLRGVAFVQVPTTLLAAVDASVGGKVGLDHPAGKNLIGAFHQPRIVVTDIDTFQTLPLRELRAGLAECIKHAVIRNAHLFSFITDNLAKVMACDGETLAELVARNVAIKAAIVAEDPFENGVRALLNFGHTFGHALENAQQYGGLIHGEAVAMGMLAASRLAHRRGIFPEEDLRHLATLLDYAELPACCIDFDINKALTAMTTDKKVRNGKLRFILPTRIGHAEIVTDVPQDQVKNVLESLQQPIMAEKNQGA